MKTIYQVQIYAPHYHVEDYSTLESAKACVETAGSGSVTTFIRERNLPNCLPEFVDRSCAMITYESGAWRGVNIFGA